MVGYKKVAGYALVADSCNSATVPSIRAPINIPTQIGLALCLYYALPGRKLFSALAIVVNGLKLIGFKKVFD